MEVDAPQSGAVAGGDRPDNSPFTATDLPRSPADFVRPAPAERISNDSAAPADPVAVESEEHKAELDKFRRELEQFVQSYTAPSPAASAWRFLAEGDQRLRLEVTGLEFAEAFRKEYSDDWAVSLKLFTRVGEQLEPAAWLTHSPLYVTSDTVNRKLGFHWDDECLFPNERSALDFAAEIIDAESAAQTRPLFVVESEDAAEILQRLGLTAVSCEGLSKLVRHDVSKLFSGDYRSDANWRYFLILLDFDVWAVKNQRVPGIASVIERLADAADVYDFDPARRFAVCRPTAEQFQLLERAVMFEDPCKVAQLFQKWAAAAQELRIASWRTYVDNGPVTLSATRAALTRAVIRQDLPFNNDEIRRALAAYRAAGADVPITRFYEAAESEKNPFDQLDLIAAASCAEDFFHNDPLVRRAEGILSGTNPPSVAEIREQVFERQQNSLAELRRIRRGRNGKR